MSNICVINGPNLNMLGIREPGHYGKDSLDSINSKLMALAKKNNVELKTFQSNSESQIVNYLHEQYGHVDFIIINPAAFTHTSISIRDAILAIDVPFIEVHLSNTHSRENFRQSSFFSDIAKGVICGLGTKGYEYALTYAIDCLK